MNDQSAPAPSMFDYVSMRWRETNEAIGEASGHGHPADPYLLAALFESRAGWFSRLAELADKHAGAPGGIRNVYAIACSFAAELDRQSAAETRFRYRIPTMHPGAEAIRLGLTSTLGHFCSRCGRPWQRDRHGACPACPDLLKGITPHNRTEAETSPPGTAWID